MSRYSIEEWVEHEADSYREYLDGLTPQELVEEAKRQGVNARFLADEDVIEVEDEDVIEVEDEDDD